MSYVMSEKCAMYFAGQLQALDIPWKVDYDRSRDMYEVEVLPVDADEYFELHPEVRALLD